MAQGHTLVNRLPTQVAQVLPAFLFAFLPLLSFSLCQKASPLKQAHNLERQSKAAVPITVTARAY